MRAKLLFVLLALAMCLSASAQSTALVFELYSDTPVVTHSSRFADWDGYYTDPGAVFYHDGMFHMFRNGFRVWPGSVQIGYLTSPDGFTWTEVSEEPVLLSEQVPFTDLAALASSALVMDDGTWVLYFYTWNNSTPPAAEIGRATADDPLGPWTIDPEPVLTYGSAGSWDSAHVDAPSVIRTDDGYAMYYGGSTEEWLTQGIGMATSPDGITWTKAADPILVSDDDDYRYHQPRVERTEDGYVMVFRMVPVSGGQMGLGIATSDDGAHWTLSSEQPVWTRANMPRRNGFWFTATAYHDDTLFLYIESGSRSTDIYAASAPLAD